MDDWRYVDLRGGGGGNSISQMAGDGNVNYRTLINARYEILSPEFSSVIPLKMRDFIKEIESHQVSSDNNRVVEIMKQIAIMYIKDKEEKIIGSGFKEFSYDGNLDETDPTSSDFIEDPNNL